MKVDLRVLAKTARAMISSRLTGGGLLLVLVAFGAHGVFAPARLPPIGSLGLQDLGLAQGLGAPPALLDAQTAQSVREGAQEAVQAGLPYLARFLADHPGIIPWINFGVAILAAGLLAISATLRMAGTKPPQRGDMTITT